MELSIDVFSLTINLPKSEDYSLTSQIRRASNSISANIAEAFGRSSKKDKSKFYIYSRASAYETMSHLIYGVKIGYFENDKSEILLEKYQKLIFDLNKIIKTLSHIP